MSDRAHQRRIVEALLFAAAEPITEEMLTERLGDDTDIPGLLAELVEFYGDRGVNLVRMSGGWAFRTAQDLASLLVTERSVTRKLSRAAVETLAIVAYHQPVTRAEIEAIRGVAVAHGTLDRLMETGWVQPRGRRDAPGRPVTWVTTPAFLTHFGLDSVKDLPGIEELRAAGLLDIGPAVLSDSLPPPHEEPAEDESEA
jgi:segregation and condensation protein B